MAGHTQQPSGRGNPGPAPSPSPGRGPGPGTSERVALKKEIGLVSACTIIIGNIIGSGIFISPKGVLEHSGSVGLALFVWVLGGGITALGSLCYAELGVAIPKSGGDYAYVTEIFGGLAGFLLLWSAVLIMYPTSLAVISMTFSNYVLQPVFPNCIPPAAASRALSMACLMLLTWVNSSSVRWATRIQDVFTGGKLLALSLIIGVGFVQIFQGRAGRGAGRRAREMMLTLGLRTPPGHFEELRPSNAFDFWMTPSVGHLALAFLQGSFAFSGWNFLNYVTEELVDPRKNLPRAIFISIPLVTFVYTFTNVAYFTAMAPQELLASNAVAVTFGEKLLGYFSWVMPVSVALSTFGGINGYLFTSSRLCFSGAREGHLPSLLAMIHVRRCTPIPALLVCVSWGTRLAGREARATQQPGWWQGVRPGPVGGEGRAHRRPGPSWPAQGPSWADGRQVGASPQPGPLPVRGHGSHHARGRHVHAHQLRVLHQLPLLWCHHPGPARATLEAAGAPQAHQGEPPHPRGVLGLLGIPAGLQLHLGAHGVWGRRYHHPHGGARLLPGSILEKQTKVCAQTHRAPQRRRKMAPASPPHCLPRTSP
ncbi:asc-type amino acid transporter 1 isoform X3 [Ovis canadensis]|uniref:asc-type amino acid transporter 1 isoform X3 n=1 Tax=Ovis canadensis TaxID=37174 RepID=UPI0037513727